jgi:hypothetical protein
MENVLENTVKTLKTSLIEEVLKICATLLEIFLENLNKNTIIKSKEGKNLIEDKDKADRWQKYVEELYNS